MNYVLMVMLWSQLTKWDGGWHGSGFQDEFYRCVKHRAGGFWGRNSTEGRQKKGFRVL